MIPLFMVGAVALAVGPPIKAIAGAGVTQQELAHAEHWVQISTFTYQKISWSVMCKKVDEGEGVTCHARNVDYLRDAASVTFSGDELRLTFSGSDQFGAYDFAVEIEGIAAG